MPDVNLIDIVRQRPITKRKALDFGRVTGNNSIWLAQQQFVVNGGDWREDQETIAAPSVRGYRNTALN